MALSPHGYGLGAYQGLAFAGYFARLGIATVAANAPGHGFLGDPQLRAALPTLLREQCAQSFGTAALEGRARDVNGDGVLDPGADVLTAAVFHTRDMLRQSALDYMQIVRAMTEPRFAQPGGVDYNGDGRMDAPGDLDGDGTVDLGGTQPDGRATPFFMWGESLGGITSMILGALDPAVTAVVPIAGGAGLTDVTLRTTVGGVARSVLGATVGPILVTVPASERGPVNERRRTACAPTEMSLRWVVRDGADLGELEIACIAPGTRMQPGDDVVAYDTDAGTVRCARVAADGRLFLPLPADRGDRVYLTVYQGAAVRDYGACSVPGDAPRRLDALSAFEVVEGDCDFNCGHIPDARPGAPALARPIAPRPAMGAAMPALVSPGSGLGLRRQTAELRRFLQLAQMGIEAADPANFAPLFFLRPLDGRARPLLTMTTAGDTDVPVAAGVTFARAAGLVPFMRRASGTALDEYVAPEALVARLGRAPGAVLVERGVVESLARLERFPVPMGARYLFDVDDLDDGRQPFGEQRSMPPLRLARLAAPVRAVGSGLVDEATAAQQVSAAWQVRAGVPLASYVNAYVAPEGTHGFFPSDPAQPWDAGLYLTNLVARFFQSGGTDVPYATNPAGHQCLADSSCEFIPRAP